MNFGRTGGIGTDQDFGFMALHHLRFGAAARAFRGDLQRIAASQVLAELRNNHIGFINPDTVSNAQLQFLNNTEIMDGGTLYSCSFQFHRIKYGNRVNESGTGSLPTAACVSCRGA